jgi:L-fuconolactonase
MRIDAHHHFWKYNPAEYGWISDAMSILRRDFLPADLRAEISKSQIDGVVSVQARQSLAETEWLLDLADRNEFVRGVVGWVPMVSPTVRSDLERFAHRPKLKAVRHVLQDEPDDDYMLRTDFDRGIASLKEFGLRYDILIFERHLPQTIRLVDRNSDQVFILDHVAKPRIKSGDLSPWRENVRELARRPNVCCKISGMVTEADWKHWTPAQLRPYIDVVLDAFGPNRLMFGTDWPVCLVACTYDGWNRFVEDSIASLSPTEQNQIMGLTAAEAYGL